MKAVLIYDKATAAGQAERPWVEAEYETPETIGALLAAMGRHCDEAVPLPLGPGLVDDLKREAPDLAFNIAEGLEGPSRESIVPVILDHLGIAYTGSDGVALGISLNKALTKALAAGAGVRTPASAVFASGPEASEGAAELHYPVLVKPNFGGSSVGIGPESIVSRPADLAAVVEREVALYSQPCLVEHFVAGTDVTVGLLGNGELEAFPPAKVIAPGGLYSEEVKDTHERQVVCPCKLPPGLEEQLVGWARAVYRLIGARDFARIDYIVDDDGRAHFLEINPLPGLSPYYGVYPVQAAAAGREHTDLIGAIMSHAIKRHSDARSRKHEPVAGRAGQQCKDC